MHVEAHSKHLELEIPIGHLPVKTERVLFFIEAFLLQPFCPLHKLWALSITKCGHVLEMGDFNFVSYVESIILKLLNTDEQLQEIFSTYDAGHAVVKNTSK